MAGMSKIGSPEEENKLGRVVSRIFSGALPVGFGFRPTEEERMICLVLKNKGLLEPIYQLMIQEFHVYVEDPWHLAAKSSSIPLREAVRYFFSRIILKYSNGQRQKRTTPSGQWKITGEERKIKLSKGSLVLQGNKQTLVFYRKSASGCIRTDWIIHEYSTADKKDPYVLCCLSWKGIGHAEESSSLTSAETSFPLPYNNIFASSGNIPTAETTEKVPYDLSFLFEKPEETLMSTTVDRKGKGIIYEGENSGSSYNVTSSPFNCKIVAASSSSGGMITENTEKDFQYLCDYGSGRLGPEDLWFTDEINIPEDQLLADAAYFDSMDYI